MEKYVKDEINFYKFLNVMRQLHEVTLEQVCEGLCLVSMMNKKKPVDKIVCQQVFCI